VVIVDASVAVKWYVREALHAQAREIMAQADDLAAPDIIVTEVANALQRKVSSGMVSKEQALEALRDLPNCFSQLIPADKTLRDGFELALELRHAFPDSVYLACAAMNDASLVTDDRKLWEKAVKNGHQRHIRLLADTTPREPTGEKEG
jgi:predicted nucleic acid-binding protein